MITSRQFKSGFIVEIEKELFLVLDSQHIKPGKGGAFVRAKLKNLQNGAIAERTLRPEDAFPQAFIETKKMQYLYNDHSMYYFMDQSTYEEVPIKKEVLGDNAGFLKDDMEITASVYKDSIVGITLPSFVNLKVAYTEQWIKGDTAKGSSKPATLETGAVIKVPLFINTGDIIKVDTRTGEYAGRG